MTAGNFNWFLHTMLFVHSQRVIQRIIDKERNNLAGFQMNYEEEEEEGEDEEEEGEEEVEGVEEEGF